MICPKCGAQLDADGLCPNCLPGNLREMRKEEISGYDGVTIDENDNGQKSSSEGYGFWGRTNNGMAQDRMRNPGRIRIVTGGGIMNKILIAALITMLLAAFVFIALPLVVIVAVVALAMYFIYSFFS